MKGCKIRKIETRISVKQDSLTGVLNWVLERKKRTAIRIPIENPREIGGLRSLWIIRSFL